MAVGAFKGGLAASEFGSAEDWIDREGQEPG